MAYILKDNFLAGGDYSRDVVRSAGKKYALPTDEFSMQMDKMEIAEAAMQISEYWGIKIDPDGVVHSGFRRIPMIEWDGIARMAEQRGMEFVHNDYEMATRLVKKNSPLQVAKTLTGTYAQWGDNKMPGAVITPLAVHLPKSIVFGGYSNFHLKLEAEVIPWLEGSLK